MLLVYVVLSRRGELLERALLGQEMLSGREQIIGYRNGRIGGDSS